MRAPCLVVLLLFASVIAFSDDKRTVREVALDVSSVLENYVAVHDAMVTASNLPQALKQPIPYAKYRRELDNCSDSLAVARRRLDSITPSESARAFYSALVKYAKSLESAINKLRGICRQLEATSSGDFSYSWNQFRSDWKDYEKRVNEYHALGLELNKVYPKKTR